MSQLPMILRHGLMLVLVSLMLQVSQAQSPEQYIAKGDVELREGFPNAALFYYQLAIKQDTLNPAGHFYAGEAHRALRAYRAAAKSYQFAAAVDERDRYPEALYYLGEMQRSLGQYQQAKKSLQHFLSIYNRRDDFYRRARAAESSCDWAMMHLNDSSEFEVMALDSGLNSEHSEMSPFFFDPHTVYFSTMRYESAEPSKRDPAVVRFMKAVHQDSAWVTTPAELGFELDEVHRGNGVFSADSSLFFYTECKNPQDCKIFLKRRQGGNWSEGTPLPEPVNMEGSNSTQPALAELGEDAFLYFVSDRTNGKGGLDIWFVPFKNGEVVYRLRNAGTRINTKADEITPWFDASDTTFYFSSNGHPGYGGYDIFESKGMPGTFNTIKNVGPVVNGPADDYYLAIHSSDSVGYFASNRSGSMEPAGPSSCCNDLYKVRVLPPPVIVVEEDTIDSTEWVNAEDTLPVVEPVYVAPTTMEEVQDLLPISLYFHNDRPDPSTMSKVSTKTYLETIEEYLSLRMEYAQAVVRAGLSDSVSEEMMSFHQRFFDQDLDGSVERLNGALKVLLAELQNGSDVNISVKGYASSLASSDYNLNLTYRRIDAMINYIEQYEEGAFLPYLSDTSATKLVITKIPYGESQASDAKLDVGNKAVRTIYGPNAIQERRIEILRVETGE